MRPLLIVLFIASSASPPAHSAGKAAAKAVVAQAEAAAEHQRLSEQLRSLAGRGLWEGVEEVYLRMAALEGVQLTLDDHMRGIESAEATGRPDLAWTRAKAALRFDSSDELIEKYARLVALYGEVEIKLTKDFSGDRKLAIEDMPLDPVQRRVIEAAQEGLKQDGHFRGLLPHGIYTLGSTEFFVVGGPSFVVNAEPLAPE